MDEQRPGFFARTFLLRRLAQALGLLLLLIGVAGSALRYAARARPAWYTSSTISSASGANAERLEQDTSRTLTLVRDMRAGEHGKLQSEPWTMKLSQQEANDWLATRLRAWLEHEGLAEKWPSELREPRVEFGDGVVRIGVTAGEVGGKVLWVEVEPRVDEAGALWLVSRGAGLGKIPVPLPMETIASMVSGGWGGRAALVFSGKEPLLRDGIMTIDAGRVARLKGVRVAGGAITLDAVTEAKK